MERVLRMMIGPVLRMIIGAIANKGAADAPPEQRRAQQETARKMNQTLRVMRRVGRF